MNKLFTLVLLFISIQSSAVTVRDVGEIYVKIIKANKFDKHPKLYYNVSNEVNSYYGNGEIDFTKGMLKFVKNKDEAAWVLAHELSHHKLKTGGTWKTEEDADKLGAYYIQKAGFNRCRGTKILNRFIGDKEHSPGYIRYLKVKCK